MDAAERAQRARQHIFVVNGASEFLDIVRELLEDERYNVTTTNYVPKTFDLIETLQPSLIIKDLAVGVQAGSDLLERLAQDAVVRNIPVIVVSTSPSYRGTVEADVARFGAERVLGKPLDLEDLLRTVDELIGAA